jgi:spermidine/putrescine-binding protein
MFKRSLLTLAVISSTLLSINTAQAQSAEKVLNIYSAPLQKQPASKSTAWILTMPAF